MLDGRWLGFYLFFVFGVLLFPWVSGIQHPMRATTTDNQLVL